MAVFECGDVAEALIFGFEFLVFLREGLVVGLEFLEKFGDGFCFAAVFGDEVFDFDVLEFEEFSSFASEDQDFACDIEAV